MDLVTDYNPTRKAASPLRYHYAARLAAQTVSHRERLVNALGALLARTPNNHPRAKIRTRAFHDAVTQLHVAELQQAAIQATLCGRLL